MPCRAMDMVGFKNVVPYNDPHQLHATNPEACCKWCQADNERKEALPHLGLSMQISFPPNF